MLHTRTPNTHTHTHTHAHTHMHTHAHTRTHTLLFTLGPCWSYKLACTQHVQPTKFVLQLQLQLLMVSFLGLLEIWQTSS